MPYSVIVNNKVLDFHFKTSKCNFIHSFYIGDIFIGQIFKMKRRSWSTVSFYNPNKLDPVDGFGTRLDAAQFLLKQNEFMR